MADRERKRAARRKRKERGRARQQEMAERTEAKNRAARDTLEPLEAGDRPTVTTVGAVVSGLVCLSILVGYAAGVEVDGSRPNVAQVIVPAVLFGVMAWGMWGARYWAVLGFQTVLLLVLIWASLSLVTASEWTQAIGNVALIAGAGVLFYLQVKAMARIQMPERHTPGG